MYGAALVAAFPPTLLPCCLLNLLRESGVMIQARRVKRGVRVPRLSRDRRRTQAAGTGAVRHSSCSTELGCAFRTHSFAASTQDKTREGNTSRGYLRQPYELPGSPSPPEMQRLSPPYPSRARRKPSPSPGSVLTYRLGHSL